MEVTTEIYAWLISIGMIDGGKPMKVKNQETVELSPNLVEKLFEGKIMQIPLVILEEQYNRFYNLHLSYTDEISQFKNGSTNQIKLHNWMIVSRILNNFGITLSDTTISTIANNDKDALRKLLDTIKTLSNELVKRSEKPPERSKPLKTKQIKATVNIENLNLKKEINSTESCLEFMILTLSKTLNMKPRQAAALLSNNRKFLIQIVNKGIKSDYSLILNWFEEVNQFKRHLMHLIKETKKDGLNMVYSVLSTGLLSKNTEVCLKSYSVLNDIQLELGNDWKWFEKDGIESAVFCSNKHVELRKQMIIFFDDFSKGKNEEVFNTLKNKINPKDFNEYILNIIDIIPSISNSFASNLREFIINYCLENKDDSNEVSSSLIVDVWIHLGPLKEHHNDLILKIMKNTIRNKDMSKIKRKSCVVELFRLFEFLASKKNNYAPNIYKNLVFIFLENYNTIDIRTTFLERFENSFSKEKSIPIKILLEPYLKQLNSSKNYLFEDLQFIYNIVNHPRYDYSFADDTFQFFCYVNLTNLYFNSFSSQKILELIERKFLTDKGGEILVNFIKRSITLFLESNETIFLQTPYEIVRMGIQVVNDNIQNSVSEAVIENREKTGKLSSGLLSLLWFFDFHDDLLLMIDEKFAEKYESQEKMIKQQRELIYKQTPEYHLEKIKKKKIKEIINKRQEEARYIIRENKIKKTLKKQLEQRSIELGSSTVIKNTEIDKSSMIKPDNFLELRKDRESNKDKFTFIRIEAEEPREKKAIENLAIKYRHNLNSFYIQYIDNAQKVVSKNSFLKMFRDLGINQEILTLEELSSIVRQHFGLPVNYFNYEQFIELAYHTAYLTFSKIKPSNSISENFEIFCRLLKLREKKEDKYLLNKISEVMKENKNALLPPGFKLKKTKEVKFESKVPDMMRKLLGEGKSIAVEILDEIISKLFDSHIIESFVKVSDESYLKQTEKPNWSIGTFVSYSKMDKKEVVENNIVEIGNLIEDMLFNLEHNNKSLSFIHERIKQEEKAFKEYHEIQMKEDKKKWKKKKEKLKAKVKKLKEKNKDVESKREEDKRRDLIHNEEKYKLDYLNRMNHVIKSKHILETNKKKIEAERKEKIDKIVQKEKEAEKKKNEEIKEFIKKAKKKLKDQFVHIKEEKVKNQALSNITTPLPPLKKPIDELFKKQKSYIDFEKNIYANMQNLLYRADIKEVITNYQNHLITIYEIYVKAGQNKINFYNTEAIHYKEFRQFAHDFNLLGILITVDQLHYIFHKTALAGGDDKQEQNYLKFNDFLVALMMLCMYSKYTNKSRKLIPDDVKRLNQQEFKSFIHYLGLELPFSRKNLEDYINDRRKLTAKEEIRLKKNINDEVKSINTKKANEKFKPFPLLRKSKDEITQFEKEMKVYDVAKDNATEFMRNYFDKQYKDIKKKDLRSPNKKEERKDQKENKKEEKKEEKKDNESNKKQTNTSEKKQEKEKSSGGKKEETNKKDGVKDKSSEGKPTENKH